MGYVKIIKSEYLLISKAAGMYPTFRKSTCPQVDNYLRPNSIFTLYLAHVSSKMGSISNIRKPTILNFNFKFSCHCFNDFTVFLAF